MPVSKQTNRPSMITLSSAHSNQSSLFVFNTTVQAVNHVSLCLFPRECVLSLRVGSYVLRPEVEQCITKSKSIRWQRHGYEDDGSSLPGKQGSIRQQN